MMAAISLNKRRKPDLHKPTTDGFAESKTNTCRFENIK
jgi:hypothetical protein